MSDEETRRVQQLIARALSFTVGDVVHWAPVVRRRGPKPGDGNRHRVAKRAREADERLRGRVRGER